MTHDNPAYFGATFAERKAARLAAESKPVKGKKAVDAETDEVEDKSIGAKKTTRKAPSDNS